MSVSTLFQEYKKTAISAIITVCIGVGVPTLIWVHDAHADKRYVQVMDNIESQIQACDDKLFEIEQELQAARRRGDAEEIAKWEAMKVYWQNRKAALIRQKQGST